MKKLLIAGAAGLAMMMAAGISLAEDKKDEGAVPAMTLEGAKVMMSEVKATKNCEEPAAGPDMGAIPSGSDLSKEAFEEEIGPYVQHIKGSQAYGMCIQELIDKDQSATIDQREAMRLVSNDAIEQAQTTAEAINPEITAYKKKNGLN